MHDIVSQLIFKWARRGPEYKIAVTDDFIRLTLDTIAMRSGLSVQWLLLERNAPLRQSDE